MGGRGGTPPARPGLYYAASLQRCRNAAAWRQGAPSRVFRRAGTYVVIISPETKQDYVYMHLESAPLVGIGEEVGTRQPLGQVGDSGNVSGCHLHLRAVERAGVVRGGEAVDPLGQLRAWDGWS